MKIRAYYHVTMVEHYIEITDYIFEKMVSSGLYDNLEGIYIGALGDEDQLPILQACIDKYPKAQVVSHDIRKANHEFQTLRMIKKDADTLPTFIAVYVHSKSISYPKNGNDKGKTPADHRWDIFWMKFMVYFIVGEWRRWYKALTLKGWSYDIAGCRIIPARLSASSRTHAGGNFWSARSDYLKTLNDKTIEWAEWKDQFEVEQWGFSGNPIIYVMSNMFHDGFPFENDLDEYMASFPNKEDYQI